MHAVMLPVVHAVVLSGMLSAVMLSVMHAVVLSVVLSVMLSLMLSLKLLNLLQLITTVPHFRREQMGSCALARTRAQQQCMGCDCKVSSPLASDLLLLSACRDGALGTCPRSG